MKVLVCIAYYGTENEQYVSELISTYKAMRYDVDIVVVTESIKDLGNVEQVVGLPSENPYSLPFAHKAIFAERVREYDLFIYTEDDTLVLERNVDAFLSMNEILPDDVIPGFLRTEKSPTGELRCSSVHSHFHWVPGSAFALGEENFAEFSNPHGACYMLTRAQLQRCIASGNFLTAPHEGLYDMRVTAATDPYTVCGLRKVVCISRLQDFLLPHMTNKYTDLFGAPIENVYLEITQLKRTISGQVDTRELITQPKDLATPAWDCQYHGPPNRVALDAIPSSARRVLSVGVGAGRTEACLLERGHEVTAVPLDEVIGAVAASKGIEVLSASISEAVDQVSDRQFDAVLINDVLHRMSDPVVVLRQLRGVASNGIFLVLAPNFTRERVRRIARRPSFPLPRSFAEHGIHRVGRSGISRWLAAAGLERPTVSYPTGGQNLGRFASPFMAPTIQFVTRPAET